MQKVMVSRRKFFYQYVTGPALILSGIFLKSCGRKADHKVNTQAPQTLTDPCEDLANVSEADINLRKKLGYVNQSPIADNQCQNCNLFLPQKEGNDCGGCMLFKGPVYPGGYCTYWAPKV